MIVLEGSRGKRMSMPCMGSSDLKDGVWFFRENAYCICGKRFFAEGYFPDGGPEKHRNKLISELRDKAQNQWWECYKSHHGEFGLDALDGVI